MREMVVTPESARWKEARRTAFVQEVRAVFTQRPGGLLCFDQVSQKLNLENVNYLDLQVVPLDQIVGSVGRYTDFTRAFFPRTDRLQARWQSIEKLVTQGRSLPPVELYQVGQVYFVRDGNHRVSVARQHGMSTIRAYVWEYETPIPLEPDSDVDELLCRTAHAAFMERTDMDRLHPDLEIRLTQPDGYQDLLHEIEAYQQILSQVDGREIPFDEAVTLWCELRYIPIVEIIRERYVLTEFPGRTETDLYLWLCRNWGELEADYDEPVLMRDAADDLTARYGENPLPVRRIRTAIARMTGATMDRVNRWWRSLRKDTTRTPSQGEE